MFHFSPWKSPSVRHSFTPPPLPLFNVSPKAERPAELCTTAPRVCSFERKTKKISIEMSPCKETSQATAVMHQ